MQVILGTFDLYGACEASKKDELFKRQHPQSNIYRNGFGDWPSPVPELVFHTSACAATACPAFDHDVVGCAGLARPASCATRGCVWWPDKKRHILVLTSMHAAKSVKARMRVDYFYNIHTFPNSLEISACRAMDCNCILHMPPTGRRFFCLQNLFYALSLSHFWLLWRERVGGDGVEAKDYLSFSTSGSSS